MNAEMGNVENWSAVKRSSLPPDSCVNHHPGSRRSRRPASSSAGPSAAVPAEAGPCARPVPCTRQPPRRPHRGREPRHRLVRAFSILVLLGVGERRSLCGDLYFPSLTLSLPLPPHPRGDRSAPLLFHRSADASREKENDAEIPSEGNLPVEVSGVAAREEEMQTRLRTLWITQGHSSHLNTEVETCWGGKQGVGRGGNPRTGGQRGVARKRCNATGRR